MIKTISSQKGFYIILLVGLLASAGLFLAVLRLDKSANESRFYEMAVPRLAAIKADIATAVDTVVILGGQFSVYPPQTMSRAEFTRSATASWQRHPYIQALAGVAALKRDERQPLEKLIETRDQHPGFHFTMRGPDGALQQDDLRDQYYTVLYEVPKAGNEPAFGYDLGSDPVRLSAITKARDSGQLACTPRIKLVQGAGDQYGVLLFNPVYAMGDTDTVEQRQALHKGFAMGVFRIGDLINLSSKAVSEESHQQAAPIDVHVYDLSAAADQQQLFPKSPEQPMDGLIQGLHAEASVMMGGRDWHIVVTPTAAFSNPPVTMNAVVVFLAGIMTTIVFSLSAKRGQQRAVNQALSKTNQQLERQQAELETRSAELEDRTAELAKANIAANAANEAKSEFLSSMSHELRTPLHAIIGFSELLLTARANPLTDRQKNQVSHINRGGEYLLYLINEILEFTKIEAGKIAMKIEPVSARKLFDSCLSLAEPLMAKYGVTLHDETPADAPTLLADRVRCQQIILNLLSNAAKYNTMGGSVYLQCQTLDNGMVRIAVKDTGIGFDEAKKEELFQAFNRVGAEMTEIEGTGIGLTLVRNLADLMGGVVDCSSIPGQGSTFWLDVPLSHEASDEAAFPLPVLPGTSQTASADAPRVILYVEDNPANVSLMEDFIANFDGWRLVTAPNAELGITLAQAQRFDLIICDINLPGMNGIEAVKHFRRDGDTVPVLALSADATPATIEEGRAAGFTDYLTKPIRLKDLERIILNNLSV